MLTRGYTKSLEQHALQCARAVRGLIDERLEKGWQVARIRVGVVTALSSEGPLAYHLTCLPNIRKFGDPLPHFYASKEDAFEALKQLCDFADWSHPMAWRIANDKILDDLISLHDDMRDPKNALRKPPVLNPDDHKVYTWGLDRNLKPVPLQRTDQRPWLLDVVLQDGTRAKALSECLLTHEQRWHPSNTKPHFPYNCISCVEDAVVV